MTQVLEGRDLYRAAFDRLAPADEPAWLHALRRNAIERFERLGFPSPKDEEWRFTSVAPIANRAFRPAADGAAPMSQDQLRRHLLNEAVAARLVFVNGRFSPDRSTLGGAQGLEGRSLAAALARDPGLLEHHLGRLAELEGQGFTALNTAFLRDGAFLKIPAKAIVDKPIQLLFVSTAGGGPATVSYPRVLVLAGPESQAQLVESYVSLANDEYFTNAVTEVVVGDHAVLDHYKVVRESFQAFHIGSMHVTMGRSATFSSHAVTLGGALVRNDVMAALDGEGVECTLNGLYLVDRERLVDNHTTIDHAKPHCASHEVYKGILDGRGKAVFNGKIIVQPDAQKTDAKQTNKALLLSEDGQINTKPQLEIFADDVRCTHGATVGQLDEDALFYLRTRGIALQDARALLIQAFASDILNRVKIPELRAQLEAALLEQLPKGSKQA